MKKPEFVYYPSRNDYALHMDAIGVADKAAHKRWAGSFVPAWLSADSLRQAYGIPGLMPKAESYLDFERQCISAGVRPLLVDANWIEVNDEPTPAEVRTLLEGPEPLSECLEEISGLSGWINESCESEPSALNVRFNKFALIQLKERLDALLEKYREGGK